VFARYTLHRHQRLNKVEFECFEIVPIWIQFEHGDSGLSSHKHKLLQFQFYFIVFEHSCHCIQRFAYLLGSKLFKYQTDVGNKSVDKKSKEIAKHQSRKGQNEKCAKRNEHNDRVYRAHIARNALTWARHIHLFGETIQSQ
jgi:hypothetical protein